MGDVACLFSHHMSDPSPWPLHDDGAHAVLVAAGKKVLVGDGFGPEYLQDSSKVLKVYLTPKYFSCLNKSLHLFEMYCTLLN